MALFVLCKSIHYTSCNHQQRQQCHLTDKHENIPAGINEATICVCVELTRTFFHCPWYLMKPSFEQWDKCFQRLVFSNYAMSNLYRDGSWRFWTVNETGMFRNTCLYGAVGVVFPLWWFILWVINKCMEMSIAARGDIRDKTKMYLIPALVNNLLVDYNRNTIYRL